MIRPRFHPARCAPRASHRAAGALASRRSIALLIAGFVWLIPGFWDGRLAYAMLGLGRAGPAGRAAGRNAPAPRRATDGEPLLVQRSGPRQRDRDQLTIENHGRDRRVPPDGRSAAGAGSRAATHRLTAFPACRPDSATALNPPSAATGRRAGSTCAIARRWAWPSAGLRRRSRNGAGLPRPAHRRGAADISRPQPPDRPATAPRTAARVGPRL
jgi:hypothetical protein